MREDDEMRNEYVYMYDDEGELSHVELRIFPPEDDQCFTVLLDIADKECVEQLNWQAHFIADQDYIKVRATGGNNIPLGRYLLQVTDADKVVDFRDRNRLNMRRFNMRVVDRTANALNRKWCTSNTSGRRGVYYWKQHGRGVWSGRAGYRGTTYSKTFSVGKYGYHEARRLAIQFRESMEAQLEILSPRVK